VVGMVKGPRKAGVQSGNSPELMVSVTYKMKLILLIYYKSTKYHTPSKINCTCICHRKAFDNLFIEFH